MCAEPQSQGTQKPIGSPLTKIANMCAEPQSQGTQKPIGSPLTKIANMCAEPQSQGTQSVGRLCFITCWVRYFCVCMI